MKSLDYKAFHMGTILAPSFSMFPDIKIRREVIFLIVIYLMLAVVSGEECTGTFKVGSLSYAENIVPDDKTFILANYTVPCGGTVVAWEFCYQIGSVQSATFCPGIWRMNGTSGGNTDYALVQSNTVTYNSTIRGPQNSVNNCQIFNLSDTDQFTTPTGSVVGLYSNMGTIRPLLLHTNIDNSITTYRFNKSQSSVSATGNEDVNYNIAIRVHVVSTSDTTTVIPTNSIVSTSDATTVTPTTSIVSTSDTATIIPTTSPSNTISTATTATSISMAFTIVSNDTTTTPATSLVPTSDAPTATASMVSISVSDTTKVRRTEAAGTGSDSGGGSPIGIIAGAVIGVILCIIVLLVVIFLLWRFSRTRKDVPQVTQNPELMAEKSDLFQESTATNNGYYSTIEHNNKLACKNVVSEHEAPSYKNVKGSNDISLHSKDSTGKSYSRFSCNDYEATPNLAVYETSMQLYYKTTRTSTTYNESISSEYSEITDATDEEEIYSDPGHSKEDIYACFEKKKFRMIKRNDISILQELGSGEFGVVHLGTWTDVCSDPVKVAVKTLNSQCSESERVKFLREGAIMGQFKHQNVVQLHGVVFEKENIMIVLEYMPKGDLREFLIDLKNATPPETFNELKHDLLSYCRHVSAGLSHLASKGFVHRDLAARNILVSSDDVCKIADFGMARDVTDDTYYVASGGKIPVKWTAPEAIFYKKYSVQSDVWSFGCVMYEIWSLGYKPYEDLDTTEYIQKITTGYRLPPPPGCPRAIYELMIQCWHPVANQRINSCLIFKALQKSDRALLPGTISAKDNEELSTGLGDPLASSSHLYQDLQNTYLST